MADHQDPETEHTPARGRESLLVSGLALVWVTSFAAVAARAHGSESLVHVFWGVLGGGLLSFAGVVLGVSGLRQEHDRPRAWVGLLLSLFILFGIAGLFLILG